MEAASSDAASMKNKEILVKEAPGTPGASFLFLVQLEDGHKSLSGQLDGVQRPHFLLAAPHPARAVRGPLFFSHARAK